MRMQGTISPPGNPLPLASHGPLKSMGGALTKVKVNSGVCGFTVLVSVKRDKDRNFHVSLETECEMVKRMEADIAFLEFKAPFSIILHNPVYRSASKNLKHAACPAPSAILKAIEVEAGACLARPVTITFAEEQED